MSFETHCSDELAASWVAEKLQPQGEILQGSVPKCCLQRGILLALLSCLDVEEIIQAVGNGIIHCGMRHPHQQEIPQYYLTASSGSFQYETYMVHYCA
jgi:hypothetical protein